MIEIDEIIDDWHALRKAKLGSRKKVGSLVRTIYTPDHSIKDTKSPLWWRQQMLRNKWSGQLIDSTPLDGSALIGICSVPGVQYITYLGNKRHQERLEMLVRILSLPVIFCESQKDFETYIGIDIRSSI
jgi:hypothetical protein